MYGLCELCVLCSCREMIFSKLAPELFPTIRPSVEYLAEEVPVPIPSADSEYVLVCCVVYNNVSRPAKINHVSTKNRRFFRLYSIITYKLFVLTE